VCETHRQTMSSAPSLYRRHRPRTFDDVVGQEHVVRTLRNAVEQDKVHHAYLFVGSRGTGKTSMAKILAACLNCSGVADDPRPPGPTTAPCGRCDSCRSIQSASSLDVIEMDAASNNSVDDIRELRDSVQFAPVSGRYKVYILDEAHMLSPQAWNAFLKTLEEPPPSTIFVLATTEAAKVLPTVVDRCHRFDFARPTVEQLARVVQRVADQESIAIPADAVALLARHATGSFRDALGTLEQLVTYSGTEIVTPDVLAVLGIADAELLFGALDAVASHDARSALGAAAQLVNTGRDVSQFVRDLEAHARELLITETLGAVPPELSVTPDRDARLAEQAKRVPAADVVRLIDLLAAALRATKDGADGRTQLELALVKAATPEVDASTKALLARLERLERALAAAAAVAPPPEPARAIAEPPPPPAPARPASPGSHPTHAGEPIAASGPAPVTSSSPLAAAFGGGADATPARAGESPHGTGAARDLVAPPVDGAHRNPRPSESHYDEPPLDVYDALPPAHEEPPAASAPAAPTPAAPAAPVAPVEPSSAPPSPVAPAPPSSAPPAPGPAPSAPAPLVAAPALAPPEAPTGVDLAALEELWPAVLDSLREQHALLHGVIAPAVPTSLDGHDLVLAYDPSQAFFRRKAEAPAHRAALAEVIRTLVGFQPRLSFELVDPTTLAQAPPQVVVSEAEWVERFKQEFDAQEIVPDPEESKS